MTQGAKSFFPAIGSKFNACHDNLGQFCSTGGESQNSLLSMEHVNKEETGKPFSGQGYRYGNEGKITFYSKERDYAEAYAEEKRGNPEDVREYSVSIKNPLVVDLPSRKFSDPSAEKPYIDKVINSDYDGVIFRNDIDAFYVVIK